MPKKEKQSKQLIQEKQQKKRKGRSVQELIGVKTFTKYGLMTQKGELLFYLVSPTNISVLSYANIEIKIRHLMMVLSSLPDIPMRRSKRTQQSTSVKMFSSSPADPITRCPMLRMSAPTMRTSASAL